MKAHKLKGEYQETVKTEIFYHSPTGIHKRGETRLKPIMKLEGLQYQTIIVNSYEDDTIRSVQCCGYTSDEGLYCKCFSM